MNLHKYSASSARRVVFTAPGHVVLEPFDPGEPDEGQVLIETLYSAISPGTERAHLLAEANTVTRERGFPFRPGYSNVGRVVRVGEAVKGFRPGELVATVQPHQSHILLPATSGAELPAEKYRSQLGSAYAPESGFSSHHLIWSLEGELDAATLKACATFNFSKVGLAGARSARIELGEAVLVLGLGPIGLYAAQFAQLMGGFPVLGLDPSPVRRQLASKLALDGVHADAAELRSIPPPPVVIEATGRPEAIPLAFQLCGKNGRVVLLGSTRGLTEQVNFYTDVHKKGLVVTGVHELTRPFFESTPGNWTSWDDAALLFRLIRAGRIDCAPLLTHEFPVARVAEAYRVVQQSPEAIAVILDWR